MRMRRLGALGLAGLLALSLAGCGGGGETSSQGSGSMPEEPSVSAIAPVEPEPDPEPEHPYAHPLTGEGMDEDISGQRPVAVMFNNLEKALPQIGIGQADVVYEIVAEGGITRLMGLFQDLEGAGDLGSIRSAREYYVNLANGHDAIYIHAGGSPQAYDALQGWGMNYIDFVNGPYDAMYWRDKERRKTAGFEHSLLTSSERVLEQMPSRFRREHQEGFQLHWVFGSEAPAGGEPAGKLTVPFSTYKTGYFSYDQDSGRYLVSQTVNGHDHDLIDGGTGQEVSFANVLVLYTDISRIKGDEAGRLDVRTHGQGEGLLLRDGTLYPITWARDGRNDTYSFLDGQGEPIPLAVGSSYINIVGTDAAVVWE